MHILSGIVNCSRCSTPFEATLTNSQQSYQCLCPRTIPAGDLDEIVIGLTHDYCLQLRHHQRSLRDGEPDMVSRFVALVSVGSDWSRPVITWRQETPGGLTND